jgi:hypothetical protein
MYSLHKIRLPNKLLIHRTILTFDEFHDLEGHGSKLGLDETLFKLKTYRPFFKCLLAVAAEQYCSGKGPFFQREKNFDYLRNQN